MRRHFILTHYYRKFYQYLQNLTQGSKSVEDYHKKTKIAMINTNIEEDKEATMSSFLASLNYNI